MIALWLATAGCSETSPVHEYVVKRPPVQGSLWFFKVLGPEAAVDQAAAPLRAFIESVSFDERAGTPQWKLPEGWTEEKTDNPIRFKTIQIPGESPLELAVTQVSGRVPPSAAEIEAQTAMLREQVGVGDAAGAPEDGKVKEPSGQDSQDSAGGDQQPADLGEAINVGENRGRLFDYTGVTPRFGKTRLLTAMIAVPIPPHSAGGSASEGPASGMPGPSGEPLPFTFHQPPEWHDAPQTTFSVVSMATGEEDQEVKITVTPAIGGLFANVNRWRGQTGLDPLEEDQLEEHLQSVDAGGKTVLYVEEIGASRAILGGVLSKGQSLWFVKADGPPAAVEAERARFRAFLESFRAE